MLSRYASNRIQACKRQQQPPPAVRLPESSVSVLSMVLRIVRIVLNLSNRMRTLMTCTGGTKMKTNMNGDLEDIPMEYFWYPFLAIVTMVVAAVAVVIKMV